MLWTKLKHESCAACGRDSEVGTIVELGELLAVRLCLSCIVWVLVERAGGEREVFHAAVKLNHGEGTA